MLRARNLAHAARLAGLLVKHEPIVGEYFLVSSNVCLRDGARVRERCQHKRDDAQEKKDCANVLVVGREVRVRKKGITLQDKSPIASKD